MRIPAALVAVLLLPGLAHAQSAGAFMANPAFQDPPPAACETTVDLQHCAAHDLRLADRQMGEAYFAARARLGATAKKRLLADQRKWLKARDSDCLAEGRKFHGGTMAPVIVAQCWVETTRQRTAALKSRRG